MQALEGKTAMITGAAGGIGSAIARAFAREGVRLAISDTDEAALTRLKRELDAISGDAVAVPLDVTDCDAVAAVAGASPVPDILVNCAGVFISGGFLGLSMDDWDWVLGVNLIGTINVCHHFIPRMVARGQPGPIVNLASMYGYWPSPAVSGYLTSKFALFGFSESLREDLRSTGIRVSTVCPGMIITPLVRNMRIRNAPGNKEAVRNAIEKRYARRNYSPDRVARAVVRAIRKEKGLVLVSPEARIMYHIERYCPRLSRFIARRAAARLLSG